MSRPGVTFQDIANAAQDLKGQGKTVTIENVRAILGTGSIGTINRPCAHYYPEYFLQTV